MRKLIGLFAILVWLPAVAWSPVESACCYFSAQNSEPATLEWAKKITENDLGVLDGSKPYNRQAPEADVKNLKILKGHVQKGQFVTKLRKVFAKDEMNEDLEFVRAKVGDKEDNVEYFSILPTSPP
jgi:hypothetical protein